MAKLISVQNVDDGALLIVQGRTYAAPGIRTLYRQHEYPLNRKLESEIESLEREVA